MKSEIQLAFENCKKEKRPALITYTVASDPNKMKSLEIISYSSCKREKLQKNILLS